MRGHPQPILFGLLLVACAAGQGATLSPIPAQTIAVNETLTLAVRAQGADTGYSFRYEGPNLPSLGSTASLSEGEAGAEFRWTPLANHVGKHEFTFLHVADGS
ncbi:MAG: hypothetical protein KC416_08720, partial [Myxococcales bacterium]|nr:hypothetical protein [Myxococcales bacterium]